MRVGGNRDLIALYEDGRRFSPLLDVPLDELSDLGVVDLVIVSEGGDHGHIGPGHLKLRHRLLTAPVDTSSACRITDAAERVQAVLGSAWIAGSVALDFTQQPWRGTPRNSLDSHICIQGSLSSHCFSPDTRCAVKSWQGEANTGPKVQSTG